jgi:hypothetical protein
VNPISTSGARTVLAGVLLLVPAAVGLLPTGVPGILSPFPLLTVLPAFFLADVHLFSAVVAVPMLLFFIWNPQLFRGEPKIPKRSNALLAGAGVLSVIYFVTSWEWGLHYQGAHFVIAVALLNVAWFAVLAFGFVWSWRRGSSFNTSLFWHWMLFAWLAWYAFPYLGELP